MDWATRVGARGMRMKSAVENLEKLVTAAGQQLLRVWTCADALRQMLLQQRFDGCLGDDGGGKLDKEN